MDWKEKFQQIWNSTKDVDPNIEDLVRSMIKKSVDLLDKETINPWTPTFLKPQNDSDEIGIEGRPPPNSAQIRKFGQKEIRYDFNNYGFRCEDIEEKTDEHFSVVTLGCSVASGHGLNVEDRFSDILCKKIQNVVTHKKVKNYNIAMPGHSNDYIARALYKSLHTIDPDLIVILFTFRNRYEWINEAGMPNQYSPDDKHLLELFNDNFLMYMFFKNILIIDLLCAMGKKPFISGSLDPLIHEVLVNSDYYVGYLERDNLAFDGEHPGIEKHKEWANLFFKKFEKFYDQETRRNI